MTSVTQTGTTDRHWRSRAACLSADPELFFPIGNSGPAVVRAVQAKAVCQGCEVVGQCLRWAIEARVEDGVWGGLDEDERRSLARRQARAPRAARAWRAAQAARTGRAA